MEEVSVLKQKRSIGKPLLSLFMAILLVLQTVMFSAGAYAESVPNDSGTEAVSESASPSAEEPLSVPEAVYDAPNNFVAMAAVPTDKTAVFMEANSTFPLKVTQELTLPQAVRFRADRHLLSNLRASRFR